MPLPKDDSGGRRKFRQVARRYFESEVLGMRRELEERKAEVKQLRAALERIAAAEPASKNMAGQHQLLDDLRTVAREALSASTGVSEG